MLRRMSAFYRRVIPQTLKWRKDNGVTFEGDKTALIHFARGAKTGRIRPRPLQVEGATVPPSASIKILGVIFDEESSFKDHVVRAAKLGWESVHSATERCSAGDGTAALPSRGGATARLCSRMVRSISLQINAHLDGEAAGSYSEMGCKDHRWHFSHGINPSTKR